jgi:transcriptional regulator with XRE-family HTH domain
MRVPTEPDKYIGERIKEARIAASLSQKDLADMLGVSYQQIQKYESGHNRISGARMGRLITALNRPFTYFFPSTSDVRAAPAMSAMLASKHGQRVATKWPTLAPAWQAWVAETVELLAKEKP